jgi:hypothetical protein
MKYEVKFLNMISIYRTYPKVIQYPPSEVALSLDPVLKCDLDSAFHFTALIENAAG